MNGYVQEESIVITKACVEVTLSKLKLDESHYGYQKPLGDETNKRDFRTREFRG